MISQDSPTNLSFLSKKERYDYCAKAVSGVSEGEPNLVTNLANTAAILHLTFGFWWTGFYLVSGSELVLGPFQGPVACNRISFGKGVCGSAWKAEESILVADVHSFPGHIACSAESNSEIVVPIIKENSVVAVLDIDSEHFANFDETDKEELEKLAVLVAAWF